MQSIKLLLFCLFLGPIALAQTPTSDQKLVVLVEPIVEERLEMLLHLDSELLKKGGWDKETLKGFANPKNEDLYEHLTEKLGNLGFQLAKQFTSQEITVAASFVLKMDYQAHITEGGAISLMSSFTLMDKDMNAIIQNTSLHKALKALKRETHK